MKRKIMLVSTFMLALLLVVGGTLAWFTATADPVENKFKAGTLDIELIDIFDEAAAQNVNPGDCFYKEIRVKNNGTKKAYVRIKVEDVITAVGGGSLSADVIKYNLNGPFLGLPGGWIEKDGYFYYNRIVHPGHTTVPLLKLNKVCFDGPGMGNEYQGADISINVEAEAIQVTNGAPAQLWPEAPFMWPLSVEEDTDMEFQVTEEDVVEIMETQELEEAEDM